MRINYNPTTLLQELRGGQVFELEGTVYLVCSNSTSIDCVSTSCVSLSTGKVDWFNKNTPVTLLPNAEVVVNPLVKVE